MKYLPHILISLYVTGFIFTFGHAYTHHEDPPKDRIVSPNEIKAVDSLTCSIFWPLYWSIQAQTGT